MTLATVCGPWRMLHVEQDPNGRWSAYCPCGSYAGDLESRRAALRWQQQHRAAVGTNTPRPPA